jgi:hypothetical protein
VLGKVRDHLARMIADGKLANESVKFNRLPVTSYLTHNDGFSNINWARKNELTRRSNELSGSVAGWSQSSAAASQVHARATPTDQRSGGAR